MQLPDGASVARTSETVRKVEQLLKSMPQVQDVFAVIGFSLLDTANEANTGFLLAKLRPFEDRRKAEDSAQALIRKTFAEGEQIRDGENRRLSICRRSSACPPAAASSISSRRSKDRIRSGWVVSSRP